MAGVVQPVPILIAAGGGGSSSTVGSSLSPDGQGLINPWDSLIKWQALVTKEDTDAGKTLMHYETSLSL